MSNSENGVSVDRMIYLKLFNQIMRMEHENKRKKAKDADMQQRIKKLIQSSITNA